MSVTENQTMSMDEFVENFARGAREVVRRVKIMASFVTDIRELDDDQPLMRIKTALLDANDAIQLAINVTEEGMDDEKPLLER